MTRAINTSLRCNSCGITVPGFPSAAPTFKCPNYYKCSLFDHVLLPSELTASDINMLQNAISQNPLADEHRDSINPFIRYRILMYPYRVAIANGMTDGGFIDIVEDLNEKIKVIQARSCASDDCQVGFARTPMFYCKQLNTYVKDESNNVAQSHKARHLFNLMIYLLVVEQLDANTSVDNDENKFKRKRLAVASCGNAGLAAATIAAAADWPIDVCIPESVDPQVASNLKSLGPYVNTVMCSNKSTNPESNCSETTPNDSAVYIDHIKAHVSTADAADPTVSVFMNLVEKHGSIPFSVQGNECGLAIEGVQTLAYEIIEQAAELMARENKHAGKELPQVEFSSLFVQVGGGALGSGLAQGFQRAAALDDHYGILPDGVLNRMKKVPSLITVQSDGNAPLLRAYKKMKENGKNIEEASKNRAEYMYPWSNPTSIAHGILDDETYDWVELVKGMESTNGDSILVDEDTIVKAYTRAHQVYNINACHTGCVGLAGLMSTLSKQNNNKKCNAAHENSNGCPSICILSGMDRSKKAEDLAGKSVMIQQSWTRRGITYRMLESTFDPDLLFHFNKAHGSTPLNFIPDDSVKEHLSKLSSGETIVWGAFSDSQLVGFITAERGGDYWVQSADTRDSVCFVHEFVVHPDFRGKRIGITLTSMTVDRKCGIFAIDPSITEMYTTVHAENVTSRTAFVKGGYREAMTYEDAMRKRKTTVLKFVKDSVQYPQGNSQGMIVVGCQSGNAVDGIDVGIFEFQPLVRSSSDPRALARSMEYKVIANKTFPFTKEERNFILNLRAMRLENGVGYAEGNYKIGEWCAKCINDIIAESGIDKSEIGLIGSHGQTVSGHPHWELGDISVIAQMTGITVAGDFRPADVAAGGKGTPCTCTYDSIMLRPTSGKKWRVCINIGGTSSVTFCPPWPLNGDRSSRATVPLGLDPGLGVFFMDLTVKAIDPELEYDDNGDMARSGCINGELLQEFLKHPYYMQKELPIGVGPDDFPESLWEEWRLLSKSKGVSDIDLLATFTELTARQIALACANFGGEHVAGGGTDDIVLRGGVCNNSYFVERLRINLEKSLGVHIENIKTMEDLGLDGESWENAMYAMFGYLCFNNIYNFIPSCTGASRPVVGGRIAPGDNFHSVRLKNIPM